MTNCEKVRSCQIVCPGPDQDSVSQPKTRLERATETLQAPGGVGNPQIAAPQGRYVGVSDANQLVAPATASRSYPETSANLVAESA